MTGQELTPRELAIGELALDRAPSFVAASLDVPESAVRRLAALMGWPKDTRELKRAALAIKRGSRMWAGELADIPDDVEGQHQAQPAPTVTPDAPVECIICGALPEPFALWLEGRPFCPPCAAPTSRQVDGCPEDCGGCSCHLGNSAPCNHCTDNHDGIDVERCDECETTGRNCAAHREDPMPPRTRREPIPIETDVEQAMTAGAAKVAKARAAVERERPVLALDNTEVPADLDPVVDLQDHAEARPMAGHGLDAAVEFDGVPDVASVEMIDRELMADTSAILQLFDRLDETAPLDRDQRSRAAAVREAGDIVLQHGASVADLLDLADYIVTGTVPIVRVHS